MYNLYQIYFRMVYITLWRILGIKIKLIFTITYLISWKYINTRHMQINRQLYRHIKHVYSRKCGHKYLFVCFILCKSKHIKMNIKSTTSKPEEALLEIERNYTKFISKYVKKRPIRHLEDIKFLLIILKLIVTYLTVCL